MNFLKNISYKEHILFFCAALILSYFILHSTIEKKTKEYYVYFAIITIVLYFFFIFVLSDTYSKKIQIEKYTNGLDDFSETFVDESSENKTSEEEEEEEATLPATQVADIYDEEPEFETPEVTPQPTPTPEPTPVEPSTGGGGDIVGGGDVEPVPEPLPQAPISEDDGLDGSSETPDVSGYLFNKPTTGNAYGPLNINVSYKVQDYGGNDKKKQCDPVNPYTDNLSDLGKYNYKSRVYNNTQWWNTWDSDQYGKQAWTNQPDQFIPPTSMNKEEAMRRYAQEQQVVNRPQYQNDVNYKYNSTTDKQEPCPVEINDPWSPYMSGDLSNSEPQPFNL